MWEDSYLSIKSKLREKNFHTDSMQRFLDEYLDAMGKLFTIEVEMGVAY